MLLTTAHGQQTTGALIGTIVDDAGQPVEGASIEAYGESVPGEMATISDEGGLFRLVSVPIGHLTLTVSHVSYHEMQIEGIRIRLGQTTSLGSIELQPRTHQLPDVVVTAAATTIDPRSTAASTNLSAREFMALPTERDYLSITSLAPEANVSYLGDDVNVAGATGQENAYYVDGINTTDMYRATGAMRLPYNFVKEIEVKSGGYEAEFGRATGGIVNVITHQGSNDLSVSAFGFLTNNSLAQDRRRGLVGLDTGEFTQYDAGLSVSGPIVRDRLWYYGAVNSRVESEDIGFEGIGVREDRTTVRTLAGKLTWRPAVQSTVTLTVLGDPTKRDLVGTNTTMAGVPTALANPDPFLGEQALGGISWALRGSHLIRPDIQIEGALSRYRDVQESRAATQVGRDEPLFVDNTTGVWSGGFGEEYDRVSTRDAAALAATYQYGASSVKAGLQLEDNTLDELWVNANDAGPNLGTVFKNSDSVYVALPWFVDLEVRNRVVSSFVQACVAVHPRLRLNAGLRWEGQYLSGARSGFTHSIADQWMPRLGFIFQPDLGGRQKVTGSFGRYYEELPSRAFALPLHGLYQQIFDYHHDPREDPDGYYHVTESDPTETGIDPNMKGEHFDELVLGYEHVLAAGYRLGVRASLRTQREIIQNVDDLEAGVFQAILGNPGRGRLDFMPDPVRDYRALTLSVERLPGSRAWFAASYTLSRNYGNYTGLFHGDSGMDLPNAGIQYDNPQQMVKGTGLLPNDRTHVLKLIGSYRFDAGLSAGTAVLWQSGTPLNELGGSPVWPWSYTFLRKRGTAGRTPSLWDLNVRLAYDLSDLLGAGHEQRLILDVFHLFSQREPVSIVQQRFLAVDPETGEQTSPNPTYGEVVRYQPPMTVRLGLEVGF